MLESPGEPVVVGNLDYTTELTVHLHIGSAQHPYYPMASMPEHYYNLGKPLGERMGECALYIHYEQYRAGRSSRALDIEHVSGGSFSGISTKVGDPLTVKMKPQHSRIGIGETKTHNMRLWIMLQRNNRHATLWSCCTRIRGAF